MSLTGNEVWNSLRHAILLDFEFWECFITGELLSGKLQVDNGIQGKKDKLGSKEGDFSSLVVVKDENLNYSSGPGDRQKSDVESINAWDW